MNTEIETMPTDTPAAPSDWLRGPFLVFDVESVGLHGEGFSVGYVVVERDGNELECGYFACPYSRAQGTVESKAWVKQNIPKMKKTHNKPREVRTAFWKVWQAWKVRGALLVADCCWPVEARFLADCVDDEPSAREWQGPYPLHDLAAMLLVSGQNPTGTFERLPAELPQHNPLCDARQSARILVGVLDPRND